MSGVDDFHYCPFLFRSSRSDSVVRARCGRPEEVATLIHRPDSNDMRVFRRERIGVMKRLAIGLAALLGCLQFSSAATVTVDGATTYQLIDGFGVNANHRSWHNDELK